MGLSGLTHRRVAEVAGVPVGSTTYYFRDLNELREVAFAAAAHAALEGLEHWRNALANGSKLPATLTRLTTEYVAERDRYRALNELYVAASHRPELRPLARLWSDGLVDILTPHTGRRTAEAVTAFIDGAVLRALIDDKPLSTTVLADALAKLVRNGD